MFKHCDFSFRSQISQTVPNFVRAICCHPVLFGLIMMFPLMFIPLLPSLQMNPQHTIPTLDDGGEYLWESAAICTYLIDKYGPTDGCALYPHDRLRRARIDQRLYFNAGILFPLLRASSIAVFLNGHAALERSLLDAVKGAMGHLVQFLEGGRFLVGDELTLADLAVAATLTNLLEWAEPLEAEQQQRLEAWLKRVADALPYFGELNTKHVAAYGEIFRQRLAQNGQK